MTATLDPEQKTIRPAASASSSAAAPASWLEQSADRRNGHDRRAPALLVEHVTKRFRVDRKKDPKKNIHSNI